MVSVWDLDLGLRSRFIEFRRREAADRARKNPFRKRIRRNLRGEILLNQVRIRPGDEDFDAERIQRLIEKNRLPLPDRTPRPAQLSTDYTIEGSNDLVESQLIAELLHCRLLLRGNR